ncbi:hypothetical protein OH214_03630 [Idiomarina abyssalis]|uniref:hypothetical protein n=1 Tax=Idiomarina abyssalis TaxID=86102 RepID=UPI001CD20991|nr:hypothetical protein [Idiomarina abyssalis]MDA6066217.1 hypothetical protein [Idiomarina abyssalis]
MKKYFVLFAVASLYGCASPGVFPIGNGNYTVTSGTSAGFSSANAQAEVYELANKFCTEKNKDMEQISMDAREGALGRNAPSATLVFKCK